MNKCVIPGTFDPIHDGHFNIIMRASKIFDSVIVAVAKSDEKHPQHSLDERLALAKEKCSAISNVDVVSFDGLLVDFVKTQNADCVVKGIRNEKDFEYEANMDAANKKLSDEFETLYLISDPKLKELSSTQVRELEKLGINPDSLTKNIDK